MAGWFRMHNEVLNDPKVQALSPEDFRTWVNLMCLISCHRSEDGAIPSIDDAAFALRMSANDTQAALIRLSVAGLIDTDGQSYAIHGWSKRQYKSDVSTERVKRFRQRFKVVS